MKNDHIYWYILTLCNKSFLETNFAMITFIRLFCVPFRGNKTVNYFSKYPSRFFSWMMMVTHVFSSHCGRWLSKLLFMFGLDWASMSFYVSTCACVCVYLYTIVAESREVRVARRYTLKKEKMGFVWCVSFIYFLSWMYIWV